MSKQSIIEVFKSVFSAFIGVQNEENRKKAFENGSLSTYIIVYFIGRNFGKNRLKNIENKTKYEMDTYFDNKKGVLYINKVQKIKASGKVSLTTSEIEEAKECQHPAKHLISEYIDRKYQHFCELCGEAVRIK